MAPLIPLAMTLAQHAPQIIRWMTGSEKAEEVAGQIVAVAEAVTGMQGQQAVDAINADPAIALKFRESVMQYEQTMDAMYLQDRQDARARDVAIVQAGKRNVRADVMVLIDAVGLLACLLALVIYRENMPGEVVALVSTIASIFGLCLRDAHQYEFGSSRGSSDKNALLAQKAGPQG